MKKAAVAIALLLVLLFSDLDGAWFVNLGEANPEPWTQGGSGGQLSIYIFSPENQTYHTNTVNLTMHVDYHLGVFSVNYSVDGSPWHYLPQDYLYRDEDTYSVTETIPLKLSDGFHNIVAKALGLGATVCTNVTFTIDTVTPHLSVMSPKNQTYKTSNVPLDFTAFRLSDIQYSLDGKPKVSVTEKTILGVPDGFHSIVYYGTLEDGTTYASNLVYFGVDTGLPKVTILSIENKTYYTRNLTLNFTVSEPVTEMGYNLDGNRVAIDRNVTLPELPYGSHYLTVNCHDAVSGNYMFTPPIFFSIASPFPTTLVLVSIVLVAVISIGLLVFFKKRKR